MPLDGSILQAIRPKITVPQGLAVYYPLDLSSLDVANAVARNQSGLGTDRNGTLVNFTSAAVKPGKVGQALLFNGTSQSISSSYSIAGLEYTFAFWVKDPTNNGYFFDQADRYLLSSGANIGGNNIGMYDNANIFSFGVTVSTGWQHLAVTIQTNRTTSLYKNGRPAGTPFTIGSVKTLSNLRLMSVNDGTSTWVGGTLDDFRIYTRALGAQEILSIYEAGRCGRA
jgi:hypothetical protein